MNTEMEKALGGTTAIRDNANALNLRTSSKPFIDPNTQPVIYAIIKKIADKKSISVEEYQHKIDSIFL